MSDEITRERLDELERIAQAATQGEWNAKRLTADETGGDVADSLDVASVVMHDPWADFGLYYIAQTYAAWVNDKDGSLHDAQHIAAFDPPTALALITALRAAWEREEQTAAECWRILHRHNALIEQVDEARAKTERYHEHGRMLKWSFERAGIDLALGERIATQHATGDENVSQDVNDA
jgi:hypothetical protein